MDYRSTLIFAWRRRNSLFGWINEAAKTVLNPAWRLSVSGGQRTFSHIMKQCWLTHIRYRFPPILTQLMY